MCQVPHSWHHLSFFLLSCHPPGVRRAVESLSSFCDYGCASLYFLSFQRSLFRCKLRVSCGKLSCFSHLQLFTLCYQYFPTNMQFRGCYADTNANGYITRLFHYSACFLKSIKSPFCRCSYGLPAQSYLYSVWKRSLVILVSWSQLRFRIIWINWSPTPSIQTRDPDKRWALVKKQAACSRHRQAKEPKGKSRCLQKEWAPRSPLLNCPVSGCQQWSQWKGCKMSEPQGPHICPSSITQPATWMGVWQLAPKGRRILGGGRTNLISLEFSTKSREHYLLISSHSKALVFYHQ